MTRWSTASGSDHRSFLWLCSLLPSGRIVNVGAGIVPPADMLRPDQRVFSVDHVWGPTIDAVGDATALPFTDRSFEGVLLKDVVEHVVDPLAALTEAGRVVCSGGMLVLTTPRAVPRAVWADPTHLRGFTASSLSMALGASGWSLAQPLRRIGPVPGAGHVPGLLPLLPQLLRVPGVGHRFGTNWLVIARRG